MASRYFVTGGDGNYGSTGNWSTTSGGASGSSVPTSSDDVFLDANSGAALTVNTSARAALSLNCTGYTGSIVMSQTLTVSGNVTLSAAMTSSGSSALIINASAALNTLTNVWSPPMTFSGAITITLGDNLAVSGLLTIGSAANAITVNGSYAINASGSVTLGTSGIISGVAVLNLTGTGTYTFSSSTENRILVTVNTSGTVTFPTATMKMGAGGGLVYTAGTISGIGNLTIQFKGSVTVTLSGLTILALDSTNFTGTVTLGANLTLSGSMSVGATTATLTFNAFKITIPGGFTGASMTTGIINGTTVLEFTDTCSITTASLTTGRVANPITFNASGKTITVNSPFNCDLAKVSYTAGTIIAGNTWATGGTDNFAKGVLIGKQLARAQGS